MNVASQSKLPHPQASTAAQLSEPHNTARMAMANTSVSSCEALAAR